MGLQTKTAGPTRSGAVTAARSKGKGVQNFRPLESPGRPSAVEWKALHLPRAGAGDAVRAERQARGARFLANLGPIRLVQLTCEAGSVHQTTGALSPSSRQYALLLQARGAGHLVHYGHQESLSEGDLLLCDLAAPRSYHAGERAELVMLHVPSDILEEHLPSPEPFCGLRLGAAQGLTHPVTSLVLSLCTRLDHGLAVDFQDRVARHLLDMIATCYAIAFDSLTTGSSILNGRYARIKLLIEQNLRDPDLSPSSIADQIKVSSRYLRMIFATGRETASAYILRRRLEECARQLSDPRWRGHSTTKIAFAWGFNSAPHFTRSFRGRYGVSPRHYRQLHQERDVLKES
jgi:AraC family transcriptional regulator, positive regulator of tynA and feaB